MRSFANRRLTLCVKPGLVRYDLGRRGSGAGAGSGSAVRWEGAGGLACGDVAASAAEERMLHDLVPEGRVARSQVRPAAAVSVCGGWWNRLRGPDIGQLYFVGHGVVLELFERGQRKRQGGLHDVGRVLPPVLDQRRLYDTDELAEPCQQQ
jgi:hypothetical protein